MWFLCSSALFLLYFVFTNKLSNILAIMKNIKKTGLIGFISGLSAPLWSYSIVYTGASNTAFISQFYIIFSIIFGVMFLHERIFRIEGIGVLFAIIGGLVMTYSSENVKFLGAMIVLLFAFLSAIQYFLAKVFSQEIDSSVLAGARSIFVFICLSIYISIFGIFFPGGINSLSYDGLLAISLDAWILAFVGAIFGPFGGMMILFKALSLMEISKSITIRTISQFLTMLYSFILLSVIPTVTQLIGGTLIVVGVILLSLNREKATPIH
jgi:drug/metabolite transporter (DMT)-like permease